MDAHPNGRITNINSGHVETRYVKAAETSAAAFSSQFCSKRDVQTTRPCAVIGPDRIIPQQAPSNVAWTQPHDDTAYYRFPPMPQYPEHFYPPRNISPRHTFQENMARIVVPPRHDLTVPPDIPNGYKMGPSVAKYSELPYTRQRYAYAPSHKTSEVPLHNVNIPPQQWNQVAVPPYSTNPYANQRIYRSASYKKPEAPPNFDPAYYSRFEPYTGKEKYPLQRYEYGYVAPQKYPEFPPSVISQPVQFPYPHPQYRTVAGRSYTVPYRNTFKYHIEDPTSAAPGKPYSYEVLDMNNRHFPHKHLPPYYGHTSSVPSRIPNPSIPYINKQIENPHYLRGYDPYDGRQNAYNPLARIPTEFSPNIISPSDSNTSIESSQSVPQHSNQEDCGYVSQCSTVSSKSIDYNKYNHPACVNPPPKLHKQSSNPIKQIDVRQFIQMWDEEFEESIPVAPTIKIPEPHANPNTNPGKNDQLYVLDLMTVPSDDLKRYEHVQKVSRLPDNIKGYDNLDLLKQFDEIVQTKPEVAYARPCGDLLKYNASIAIGQSGGPRPLSPLDVEAKISQSVIHKEVGCNFEIRPCSPVKSGIEIKVLSGPIETAAYPQITAVEQDDEHNKMFNKKREKRKLKPKFEEPMPSNKYAKISNYIPPHVEKPVINHTEQYKTVPLASLPRLDCDDDITIPVVTDMPNLRSALAEKVNPIDRDTATPPFDYNKLSKFRKMRNLNACSPALSSPLFPDIDYQSSSTDTVIRRGSIDYHEIANNHPVKANDFTEITNTHEHLPFTHDFCTTASGYNNIVDLSTVAKSTLTLTDLPLKSYESTIDSYVQSSIEKFSNVEHLYDLNVLPENEIKNDFLDDITCDYIEEKSERSIVDSLLLSQINMRKVLPLSSLCLRFVNDCFSRVIEVPQESNAIQELNNMSEILDLSCPTIHKSVLLPRVSPTYLQPLHLQKSVIVQNIPEFNETSNNSYNIDKKIEVYHTSMDQQNNHSNSINRDSTFSIPLYDSVESYFHDINLDKNEYSYEDSKPAKCLAGEKMSPVDSNVKNEHIFNLLNDDRILNHKNSHNFDTNEFMEINRIDNKGGIVDNKIVGNNKNVALFYADENNTVDCVPKSGDMILEASAKGESPLPSGSSHEKGIDDFIKDSEPVMGINLDVENIVRAGLYVENISHASLNMENIALISPDAANITHISLKLENSICNSPVVENNACDRTDVENIIHTSQGVKNITHISSAVANITNTSPGVENMTISPNMESITCNSRDVENVTISPNMDRITPDSTDVENTTHTSPFVENVTNTSSDVENTTISPNKESITCNSRDVENVTINPNVDRITPDSTDVENTTHTSPFVENVTHISSDVENITNTSSDVENTTISPNKESITCNSRDVENVTIIPNMDRITPSSTDVENTTHTSPLVENVTHISSDVENITNTNPHIENITISPNMESINCSSRDFDRITPDSADVENTIHTSPLVENVTRISSDVENITNTSSDVENITLNSNIENITCDSTKVENTTHTSPDVENITHINSVVENITLNSNIENITRDSTDVENITRTSADVENITRTSPDVENITLNSNIENITCDSTDVENITRTSADVENITRTSPDVEKITCTSPDVENIAHISSDVENITDTSPGAENITYMSSDVEDITHISPNLENITRNSSDVDNVSTGSDGENVTLDSPYAENTTQNGPDAKDNIQMCPDVENNIHISPNIEKITRISSDIVNITHDARDFCNVETEMAQLFGDKTPNKGEFNKLSEESVSEIEIEEYSDKHVEDLSLNMPQKKSDIAADLLNTRKAETKLKNEMSTPCNYSKVSSDTDDLEKSISSRPEAAEPDNEPVIFKCDQTAQELNLDLNNVDSKEHTLRKYIKNLEAPENESREKDNVIIVTSPEDESSQSYPQDTISACSVITVNRQTKEILESNCRDVISSKEVPIRPDIDKDDRSTPQKIEWVSNTVINEDTSYSETVEIRKNDHRLPQNVESVSNLVTNIATSHIEMVEIENDDLVPNSITNKDSSHNLETVKLEKDDKSMPQQVELSKPVANIKDATHIETVEKSLNVMYADEACGLEFDEVNETQIIVEDQDMEQDCVSQDEGIESTHSQTFESIDNEILLLQEDEHIGIIHIVENQVQFLQHQTVMMPSGMLNCADDRMLQSSLHLKRVSTPSYQGEETENIDDDTSNGESILLCTYIPHESSENYTSMNLSKDICLHADNVSPSPLEISHGYTADSPSYVNSSYEGSKIDHCWIDDVACVETVVSEEINGLNEDSECRIGCDTCSVSDEDGDIQSNPDEFVDTVVSEDVNEDSECRIECDTGVLDDNGDIPNKPDTWESGEINKLNEDPECKIECNTLDGKEDNGDFLSSTDAASDDEKMDMHYDDIIDTEGKIHITKDNYQKCNGIIDNESTSKSKILFDINDINIAEDIRANNEEKLILADQRNLENKDTCTADPSDCNSLHNTYRNSDKAPKIKNEINKNMLENKNKMLRLPHNKKVLKRKRRISEHLQNNKQSLKCGSIKTGDKLLKVDEPDPSNKRIKLKICQKDSGAMKQVNTNGVQSDCYKNYKNYSTSPNLEDLKPNNFATPPTRKKISLKIYQGRKNENKKDCLPKHISAPFIGNGIDTNYFGNVSKVNDTIQNVPRKPLLTKAAQKYIPPISPDQLSFKVCLPLPKTSSILQNKSICSNISKTKIFTESRSTTESCHNIQIKKKPKFDDVLKTIDDMQKCLAKTKSKKSKSRETIPKMIIKKNEYGAHYASTSPKKETFNPDLSGSKWQPWVCLERNNFIEKMIHRNKTRTLYYLALDRYRIVPTKKCVSANTVNSITVKLASNAVKEVITDISKPLKCTIKLKTNSTGTVSRKQELS